MYKLAHRCEQSLGIIFKCQNICKCDSLSKMHAKSMTVDFRISTKNILNCNLLQMVFHYPTNKNTVSLYLLKITSNVIIFKFQILTFAVLHRLGMPVKKWKRKIVFCNQGRDPGVTQAILHQLLPLLLKNGRCHHTLENFLYILIIQ